MKSLIKKILREAIVDNKVICDVCGWKWDLKEGGDDPYICHKCGNDNQPKKTISNLRKVLNRLGKKLPKEKVDFLEKFIKGYIEKNGFIVKFLPACPSYTGVRTKNQIIICSPSDISTLGDFLYVIFHEIRHEIQISKIKMDNPLSDYDLEDFEKIYNQYWEMELDADQFAKNMVSQLISKLDLSIDDAYKLFRFSSYITYYTEQSENIRQLLKRLIDVIKNMKKQGIEYNDIQDHPMIKPMLSKLQNFL